MNWTYDSSYVSTFLDRKEKLEEVELVAYFAEGYYDQEED